MYVRPLFAQVAAPNSCCTAPPRRNAACAIAGQVVTCPVANPASSLAVGDVFSISLPVVAEAGASGVYSNEAELFEGATSRARDTGTVRISTPAVRFSPEPLFCVCRGKGSRGRG